MSKYFNALAVAVLGIAMLMGAASAATTAGATVNGCLMPNDYFSLVSSLTSPLDLGKLAATNVDGGSMAVTAGGAWDLTVSENAGGDGKMAKAGAPLTNPLDVNDLALLNAAELNIKNNQPATNCGPASTVSVSYDQTIAAGDIAVGTYTIDITYTLGANV